MDFAKILAQLRGQRDLIDQVIVSIENLAHPKRGRGRPKGSVTKSTQNGTNNGTHTGTEKTALEP